MPTGIGQMAAMAGGDRARVKRGQPLTSDPRLVTGKTNETYPDDVLEKTVGAQNHSRKLN